jgi:hypothetical protein
MITPQYSPKYVVFTANNQNCGGAETLAAAKQCADEHAPAYVKSLDLHIVYVAGICTRIRSQEYTGARWRYGMRNRPPSLGTHPKGEILGSYGSPAGRARHGTLDYPRELTSDELYNYEMEFMP